MNFKFSSTAGMAGIAFTVLSITLVFIILLELYFWQGDTSTLGRELSDTPVTLSLQEPAITFPPIKEFREIIERPLFDISRKPLPLSVQTKSVSANGLRLLKLTGIVITPEKKIAVISNKSPDEILRLERGARFNGWLLLDIRADGVTFQKGDETKELRLQDEKEKTNATLVSSRKRTLRPEL